MCWCAVKKLLTHSLDKGNTFVVKKLNKFGKWFLILGCINTSVIVFRIITLAFAGAYNLEIWFPTVHTFAHLHQIEDFHNIIYPCAHNLLRLSWRRIIIDIIKNILLSCSSPGGSVLDWPRDGSMSPASVICEYRNSGWTGTF